MHTEFVVIQLVGAALSLSGAACSAALPLPDYRWYNRLAVVVGLGVCTCLVVLVDLIGTRTADRSPDPVAVALSSLAFGVPMMIIFIVTLRSLPDLYPEVVRTSPVAPAVKLMPIRIAVQLIPPVLGLVGVHLW